MCSWSYVLPGGDGQVLTRLVRSLDWDNDETGVYHHFCHWVDRRRSFAVRGRGDFALMRMRSRSLLYVWVRVRP